MFPVRQQDPHGLTPSFERLEARSRSRLASPCLGSPSLLRKVPVLPHSGPTRKVPALFGWVAFLNSQRRRAPLPPPPGKLLCLMALQ